MNTSAIKFFLVVISVFIAALGTGLLAVGCVLEFRTEMLTGYLTPIMKVIPTGGGTGADLWTLYQYTAISFIAGGIIIVFLGVNGCIVGTCPNQISAIVYIATMGGVVLAQLIGTGILASADIDSTLKETLKDNLLRKYAGDTATDEYSEAWNYAFVEFDCCAIESYREFIFVVRWDRETNDSGVVTTVHIPITCCNMPGDYPNYGPPYDSNCTTDPTQENSHYLKGCYDRLYDYIRYYYILLISCEASPILFEIAAIVFALIVSHDLRKQKGKIIPDD